MKEVIQDSKTSAPISPSNPDSQKRGSLFSANFPPLDLKEEGITKEDKRLANSNIQTFETKIAGFVKNHIGAVSTPAAVGIGLGGLAVGAGGAFFYQKVFAAERVDIGSFPNSFNSSQDLKGLPDHLKQPSKASKSEVFDNEATKGVITPEMKKIVPEEEIKRLDSFARLANQKTKIVTARELLETVPVGKKMMYPGDALDVSFEVGEDKNTIELLYPLDLSQTSNKDADIEYVESFGAASIGGDVGELLFKDKGYSDKIEFRMKDGSRIPKGTNINTFIVNKDGGYLMKNDTDDGLLDVQAPNGNIYRFLVMALKGEGLNTKIVPLEPLVPAPEFNPEFNRIPVGTYGYNIVAGQPILQLSKDADRIAIVLLGSHKGKVGETSRSRPGRSPFVVTNLQMLVSEGQLLSPELSSK